MSKKVSLSGTIDATEYYIQVQVPIATTVAAQRRRGCVAKGAEVGDSILGKDQS